MDYQKTYDQVSRDNSNYKLEQFGIKDLMQLSKKARKKFHYLTRNFYINYMLNDNIKVTNDRLDKISQDVTDLKQSLEFIPDQMKEEINKIKKDIKELDKSINEVQQDLLDPNYVSSKLIELED